MANIDSAILWPNGKIYFFSGSQYYRYDIANEAVDPGYPRPIQGNWNGLGGVSIQGAIVSNGKAYFFSEEQFYSYDIATDQMDPGYPLPTKLNWIGVLSGPQRDYRIDAAVMWPNGSVYLFQYGDYYRCNLSTKRVDPGYPLPIQGNWPGLWATGQSFTAGFVWPKLIDGRQKAYFFHHNLYMRYDITNDAVDPGYPQLIQGNWVGL